MATISPPVTSPSRSFFKQNTQANPAETSPTKEATPGYFKTGAHEETGNSALLGLLLYSFMILFFPLFVYFAAKQVMEDSFDFVPPTSVLAPAILAVGAVNVVIVAYVIKAFREENVKEKNKSD